ncbi:MAG: hypothetical protein NVS9B10_10410 [Nevskia sp.]
MKLSSRVSALLANTAAAVRIDRALDGIGQLAMHEAEALDRHVLAVRERVLVARKARGVAELVRNQFDLLPATATRFVQDHRVRRRLWRDLGQALTGNLQDAT